MYHAIIIEDDPMVASINRQYLQHNSQFHLDAVFANGSEALAYLKKHRTDLAIVDYYMPVMDGLTFMRHCRETNLKISIVMITAANSTQDISEVLRLGALDYIVKPFTYERFQCAIQKFLQLHAVLDSDTSLSQEEIDRMLDCTSTDPAQSATQSKGIQLQTLTTLRAFLKEHRNVFLSSNEIAQELQLSRITIRRYLNYLLENHEIISQIDYSTGGRPSIRYRMPE